MRKPKDDAVMGCPNCGGTIISEFTEFVTVRGRPVEYFGRDGEVLTYEEGETWSERPETLAGYLEIEYSDAVQLDKIRRAFYRCEECGHRFEEPAPRDPGAG